MRHLRPVTMTLERCHHAGLEAGLPSVGTPHRFAIGKLATNQKTIARPERVQRPPERRRHMPPHGGYRGAVDNLEFDQAHRVRKAFLGWLPRRIIPRLTIQYPPTFRLV
jgi:hypothetical protein